VSDFKTKQGFHRHANGGGWVEDTAKVSPTAYVDEFAIVTGQAEVRDQARILDVGLIPLAENVVKPSPRTDDPVALDDRRAPNFRGSSNIAHAKSWARQQVIP